MDVDGDLSEVTGVVVCVNLVHFAVVINPTVQIEEVYKNEESIPVASQSPSGILPCRKPLEANLHCGSQLAL
ncbi:hypothetical protein DB41_AX00020 [Neochlamydia sp. TUME1]|nr:hypothetical protein DB41_AX00020 [Neochlamydia sp. TUME1]